MKKLLVISSFILIASGCFAQRMVPGYLGKRFTVGYTFNAAPNLSSIIYFYGGEKFSYRGPLMKHGMKVSYVTGRREFSFNVRYLAKRIDNSAYRNSDIVILPDHERFNMIDYVLSWKRFGSTKSAPLGGYYGWELFYSKGCMNYHPYQRDDNYTGEKISHSGGKVESAGCGFSYALGRQRIFYDKLVVDYGLSVSLLVWGRMNTQNIYEEYLEKNGPRSFSEIPQFNVHLGFGYLAF
ncbi:MAG: hypothetical protein ACJ77K_09855 [Bacteroidia bacterium]